MKKQHFDYFTPIIDWAKEKNLLEKGRLTKQLLKSSEECLELQMAIESYENGNKAALEEIKDAIGDIYVTIVVASKMKLEEPYEIFEKINLEERMLVMPIDFELYISEIKKLDLALFEILTAETTHLLDLRITKYIEFLNVLAKIYGLKFVDCIELAYNTISKRKGKMIDGSFVKEK